MHIPLLKKVVLLNIKGSSLLLYCFKARGIVGYSMIIRFSYTALFVVWEASPLFQPIHHQILDIPSLQVEKDQSNPARTRILHWELVMIWCEPRNIWGSSKTYKFCLYVMRWVVNYQVSVIPIGYLQMLLITTT